MSRRDRQLNWVTADLQRYKGARAADWLDAIERQICPFCGSGPFTVVAIHVSKAHGIDRLELRDLLGLTYSRSSICDPTHAKACADRITGTGDLAHKMSHGGGKKGAKPRYSAAAIQRLRDLSAQIADDHNRSTSGRDRLVVGLITAGELTYADIAERFQVSAQTVQNIARRNDLPKQPGRQPIRPRRLCSVEGCTRPHKGHGLCKPHLRASRRVRQS